MSPDSLRKMRAAVYGAPHTKALVTLPLAALLWVVVFLWRPLPFFPLMAMATLLLGVIATWIRGADMFREGFRISDLCIGIGSAVLLYMIFWGGGIIANVILPFAEEGVDDVYLLRGDMNPFLIAGLQILIISPCEELYWRGLIQWTFHRYLSQRTAWVLGTAAYGGVHLLTGNPMLFIAAVVAGGFWGALYAWRRRLLPVAVSHAVWGVIVLLVVPLQN